MDWIGISQSMVFKKSPKRSKLAWFENLYIFYENAFTLCFQTDHNSNKQKQDERSLLEITRIST